MLEKLIGRGKEKKKKAEGKEEIVEEAREK